MVLLLTISGHISHASSLMRYVLALFCEYFEYVIGTPCPNVFLDLLRI